MNLVFILLSFIKGGYPTISKEEAGKRVTRAVEEVKNGEAIFLSRKEYDASMNEFLKSL
jgi:hypothetical protein